MVIYPHKLTKHRNAWDPVCITKGPDLKKEVREIAEEMMSEMQSGGTIALTRPRMGFKFSRPLEMVGVNGGQTAKRVRFLTRLDTGLAMHKEPLKSHSRQC